MKTHTLAMAACAAVLVGACLPAAAETLDAIFYDGETSGESAVRQEAERQAQDRPNFKSTQIETRQFKGCFLALADTTELAVFSDDGVDVYVDGACVHGHYRRPQHLPSLDESFHILPGAWQANRVYCLRVDYSNVIYRGTNDIDGATLFGYAGSGVVFKPDLTVQNLTDNPGPYPPDEEEENPGAAQPVGAPRSEMRIRLDATALTDLHGGTLKLFMEETGTGRLKIYDSPTGGSEVSLSSLQWIVGASPIDCTCYIEADANSSEPRDIALKLLYSKDGTSWCGDVVFCTAGPIIVIERDGTWTTAVGDIKRPAPDNTVKFKATIQPAGTKGRIRFLLSDVSAEKGVCLNSGDQTSKDLTFENQTGFDNPAGEKQEIVETAAGGNDDTATVTVTAHDYGAFGNIQAKIDGTATASEKISVLKDEKPKGGNQIEDAWDDAFPGPKGSNLAATNDIDDSPKPGAAGKKGDSLSRYEEYRGFIVNASHLSTNPAKMDVFYHDKDAIAQTGDFTTAKIKITVHALQNGEYATYVVGGGTFTKINPNRGHATAGLQGIVRVSKDNTLSIPGSSQWSTAPDDVLRLRCPASNYSTRVNAIWYEQFIETSAAVSAATRIIPVKANTNPGDTNIDWRRGGKITIEDTGNDETMDIIDHNGADRTGTLPAGTDNAATTLIVTISGTTWPGAGWGTLANPDEHVTWDKANILNADTKLTEGVNADATTLKVESVAGFTVSPESLAYIYVGTEAMQITDYDADNKTFTVRRGQIGTAKGPHAKDDPVRQRTILRDVKRGQGGTAAAGHAATAGVTAPRAFLVTRAAGKAHATDKKIRYGFSAGQRNAGVAMTFAHECAHSCLFMHNDVDPSIMVSEVQPGSTDDKGIYRLPAVSCW